MSFDYPSGSKLVDASGMPTNPWQNWFSRAHAIIASGQNNGPTADRPTKGLWIGRRYFDDDLGKPVYVKSVKPAVWVDGVGTVC